VIPRYVFDTGALISAERGKERASRFLQLVHVGRARILVPLPVVAEWWRGRSDICEEIIGATEIVASVPAAKAAGVALGRMKNVHARLTIDAMVIATAALADAVVITGDPRDFDRLAPHFPGVVVLSA
jgi:predicted nucleic acid-binding protein